MISRKKAQKAQKHNYFCAFCAFSRPFLFVLSYGLLSNPLDESRFAKALEWTDFHLSGPRFGPIFFHEDNS